MTGGIRVEAVAADGERLEDLVAQFEAYRAHYGGPPAAARARDWLRDHLANGRLLGFVAYADGRAAGMATVAPSPASHALGTAWSIRDLYVDAASRRRGVARALLDAVTSGARSAGVLRVSLLTEVDNTAARTLYADYGFAPVEGYVTMSMEPD